MLKLLTNLLLLAAITGLCSCMTGCAGTSTEVDPFDLFVNKEFGLSDPNADLSRKLDEIRASLAELKGEKAP